jgi:hypothetical protein
MHTSGIDSYKMLCLKRFDTPEGFDADWSYTCRLLRLHDSTAGQSLMHSTASGNIGFTKLAT